MRGVPADADMAGPNYRLLTIFGAAGCAIFSAFSLVWIINAFILYRSEDFITASETLDWMNALPNNQDARASRRLPTRSSSRSIMTTPTSNVTWTTTSTTSC